MRISMLNDLVAGKRLEVPGLSGSVARVAVESGAGAPGSATFHAAMKPCLTGTPRPRPAAPRNLPCVS